MVKMVHVVLYILPHFKKQTNKIPKKEKNNARLAVSLGYWGEVG